jgi:hypothetical protein
MSEKQLAYGLIVVDVVLAQRAINTTHTLRDFIKFTCDAVEKASTFAKTLWALQPLYASSKNTAGEPPGSPAAGPIFNPFVQLAVFRAMI